MEFSVEEIQSSLDVITDKANIIIGDAWKNKHLMENIGRRKYEEIIDEVLLDINYFLISDIMKFADEKHPRVRPQLEAARRRIWAFKWKHSHVVHGIDLGWPYTEDNGPIFVSVPSSPTNTDAQ